ncbi:MAG: NAD(P)-binding domain-containing protein [Sandaracinaceae bacterium]
MSKGKVGVIGSGQVAQVLAKGFAKKGWDVRIGSRDPKKLEAFSKETGIAAASFEDTAAHGDVLVLAVKGTAAEEAVKLAGTGMDGKLVLDATNPIAEAPPVDGILQFFTGPNDSLMERLQKARPEARFVKAWSCVGNAFMVDPQLPGGPPTMFICGNDDGAKAKAKEILADFGWDTEDVGRAAGARAIEPLCKLWCAPGFLRNQWTHAYKVLRLS